jgi:hypothetical protein
MSSGSTLFPFLLGVVHMDSLMISTGCTTELRSQCLIVSFLLGSMDLGVGGRESLNRNIQLLMLRHLSVYEKPLCGRKNVNYVIM